MIAYAKRRIYASSGVYIFSKVHYKKQSVVISQCRYDACTLLNIWQFNALQIDINRTLQLVINAWLRKDAIGAGYKKRIILLEAG